jgi:hypothetical protein
LNNRLQLTHHPPPHSPSPASFAVNLAVNLVASVAMAKMLRPDNPPPAGTASSVNRVISPAELQTQRKLSKLARSFQKAVADASRIQNTTAPARRSQRLAQREDSRPSPFFSLPAELRNRIPGYACRGLGLQFWHGNTRVGAAYGSLLNEEGDYSCYVGPEYMDRLQPGLPAWMLLNKQMLVDGLRQFHRIATFFQMNDIDNPLQDKAKPLSVLRLDQARVVDLTYNERCFLNTWEETGVDGKKYYVVGMQPEDEAINKQAVYHLVSSPALQILTIGLCYGIFNYENFDLSIHDIRSGISFFDQLA